MEFVPSFAESLCTVATNWPTVAAPDDSEYGEMAEEAKYICPSVAWSTTNPIYTALELNPGIRGHNLSANRLTNGRP
jgi:hypothetical protein